MSETRLFEPGSQWIAKDTQMNRKNGIPADTRVWITFSDSKKISIISSSPGMPERWMSVATFGWNYMQALAMPVATAYIASGHAKVPFE